MQQESVAIPADLETDWTTLVHETSRRIHIVHGGTDDDTSVIAALGHLQCMWSCGVVYVREPQQFKDVLSRHAEISKADKRMLVCVPASLVSLIPDVFNDVCAMRNVTVVLRVRAGGVSGPAYAKSSSISVLLLPSVFIESARVVVAVKGVYRCPSESALQPCSRHGIGWAWTVGLSSTATLANYTQGFVQNTSQDVADTMFWWNAAVFRTTPVLSHPTTIDTRFVIRLLPGQNDSKDTVLGQIQDEVFSWPMAVRSESNDAVTLPVALRSTTVAEWLDYCTRHSGTDAFVVFSDGCVQACTVKTNATTPTTTHFMDVLLHVKLDVFPAQQFQAVTTLPTGDRQGIKWKVFVPHKPENTRRM